MSEENDLSPVGRAGVIQDRLDHLEQVIVTVEDRIERLQEHASKLEEREREVERGKSRECFRLKRQS